MINYELYVTLNFKKWRYIAKYCYGALTLECKSNDIHQLKFILNNKNIALNKIILERKDIEIVLEIGTYRMPFTVQKIEQSGNTYKINLSAGYYALKYQRNVLENTTYTGSLSTLLNQMAPSWQFININNFDQNISVSIGSDNPLATIKKAIESAKLMWRITGQYNNSYILEYGDFGKLPFKAQLKSQLATGSFGIKNVISDLKIEVSNEYINQLIAIGKYDTGSSEFNLNNYYINDQEYSINNGTVVVNNLINSQPKSETKKFTIPSSLIGNLARSQENLYLQARQYLYEKNSSLINYSLSCSLDKFLQPLDNVKIFYNKLIENQSGTKITRINDARLVSGIQYNLTNRKIGITLTSTGVFKNNTQKQLNIELNKNIKQLTQNT